MNAPWHQHMFSMRIDPAIDDPEGGKEVVVSEVRGRVDIGLDKAPDVIYTALGMDKRRAIAVTGGLLAHQT